MCTLQSEMESLMSNPNGKYSEIVDDVYLAYAGALSTVDDDEFSDVIAEFSVSDRRQKPRQPLNRSRALRREPELTR
jgi:hypothetical protein